MTNKNLNEAKLRLTGKLTEGQDENKKETKQFLTFAEIRKERETQPPVKYLYSGIKEGSFGLVFGPSKSGKSIYCENLGMSLAVGRKNFLGYQLEGKPKKVLYISLEEYWVDRVDRNQMQVEEFSKEELAVLENNYLYQRLNFSKYIVNVEEWNALHTLIVSSRAEIVIIDSLTRMNPGELEKSKDAEQVIKQLRDLSQEIGITLFVIHHSRKNMNQTLTMDSMKGSSVIVQETDFAIGIARTSKNERYIKNVYFRYAKDDDDEVQSFIITDHCWIHLKQLIGEDELLGRADRRFDIKKTDYLIELFNNNPNKTFSTGEVIKHFESDTSIGTRKIKYDLKHIENCGIVEKPSRGKYRFNKEVGDEEE
jgi:archaellum biogenesis ATPase FlaH